MRYSTICALMLALAFSQMPFRAHAMLHDLSNTWCANNIPERAAGLGREIYYAWIEKCHARRGTKPRYGWYAPCGKDKIAAFPGKYYDMKKDPDLKRPLPNRLFHTNADGLYYKGKKCWDDTTEK